MERGFALTSQCFCWLVAMNPLQQLLHNRYACTAGLRWVDLNLTLFPHLLWIYCRFTENVQRTCPGVILDLLGYCYESYMSLLLAFSVYCGSLQASYGIRAVAWQVRYRIIMNVLWLRYLLVSCGLLLDLPWEYQVFHGACIMNLLSAWCDLRWNYHVLIWSAMVCHGAAWSTI